MNLLSLASIAASQFFLPHSTTRIPENAGSVEASESAVMDGEESVSDFNKIGETNVAISFHGMLELIQRIGCTKREFAIDLACGPGHFTTMLARDLGFKKVVGIDLSGRMLEQARANAKASGLSDRVSFICGDVTKFNELITEHKRPNLVTCTNSAHHLPTLEHVQLMLDQMEQAVGNDGFAVVMDLVRLNTEWAIKKYVSCFGREYQEAGLDALFQDFRNSMRAAWSTTEFKRLCKGNWKHLFLKPIPINQFMFLRPVDTESFFGELKSEIPRRYENEFKMYARLLRNSLRLA